MPKEPTFVVELMSLYNNIFRHACVEAQSSKSQLLYILA